MSLGSRSLASALLLVMALPASARITGTWTVTPLPYSNLLRFELLRPDVIVGSRLTLELGALQLSGITSEQLRSSMTAATFSLTRDAGSIRFTGSWQAGAGKGSWVFEPSPVFRTQLRKVAPDAWNDDKLFEMALAGVESGYLQQLDSAGYKAAAAYDVLRLYRLEIPADRISKSLQAPTGPILDLNHDNREHLRRNGVPSSYLQELHRSGYLLSTEEATQLHTQGVSTDLLRQMKLSGHDNLPVQDMLKLQTHGITSFDIQQMESRGVRTASVDDIIREKNKP